MAQITLEAPPEEEGELLQIHAARGICSTCRHNPTCTYPRDPGRLVLQCEEFEGYVMTVPEMTRRTEFSSNDALLESLAEEEPSGLHLGLCTNCANRETCTYPKAEGGVWHCDEYL
jgi:hypothetical protein